MLSDLMAECLHWGPGVLRLPHLWECPAHHSQLRPLHCAAGRQNRVSVGAGLQPAQLRCPALACAQPPRCRAALAAAAAALRPPAPRLLAACHKRADSALARAVVAVLIVAQVAL